MLLDYPDRDQLTAVGLYYARYNRPLVWGVPELFTALTREAQPLAVWRRRWRVIVPG